MAQTNYPGNEAQLARLRRKHAAAPARPARSAGTI